MADLSVLFSHWGYAAVFLAVLLGNLGVPLSEDVLFLLAGYLARQGRFSLPGIVIFGIAATVTGDNFGYWIGRRLGQPAINRCARWRFLSPARVAQLQRLVMRHGPVMIFLARFVSGARVLAGPLAGSMGLHPLVFFGANAVAAVCYVPLVVGAGYVMGNQLAETAASGWHGLDWWASAILIAIIGGLVMVGRRVFRRLAQRERP